MWWILLSCSLGPSAPGGALHVTVDDNALKIGTEAVGPWRDLQLDPTGEAHPRMSQALAPHAGQPIWLDLPADTPFYVVRKLLNSARHADSGPPILSIQGASRTFTLSDPPSYGLGGACTEGALPVLGTEPLITLSVQTGRGGTWVVGSARFLPVVERRGQRRPVDGLPDRCLAAPDCGHLFAGDPVLEAACREGSEAGAPGRVLLGGGNGCLLPIASGPGELEAWRRELPGRIELLGLGEQELLMVMPEAGVRLDALIAVIEGFQPGVPAVGSALLIQGNDGPPICNAPVRSRADLVAAGARWLGGLRHTGE
ncbi:MAG TPA: hypothetical protein ENK18_27580 [Deltaproteobacteria bacterium]|nr:hypothetical protein [Deltaproteobacteria bacterium]